MKAVILAGGLGTRIMEETTTIPKPMVEIGHKPILWHIMNWYAKFGVNEFIVCLGYKGHVIKDYFINYRTFAGDIKVDLSEDVIEFHSHRAEPWKVSLIETGDDFMTGGRIKAIQKHVEKEEHFFLTYGDGLCDVDLSKLLEFHKKQGTHATLTAISPSRLRNNRKNPHFFIFADNNKKAAKFLDGILQSNVYTIMPNTKYKDAIKDYQSLLVMSQCGDFIMSKSTFCWWAAWFNWARSKNPQGTYTMPAVYKENLNFSAKQCLFL